MPRRGPRRCEYKGAFDAEKRIEGTSRKKSHISSKLLVHSEQSRLTLVSLPTFSTRSLGSENNSSSNKERKKRERKKATHTVRLTNRRKRRKKKERKKEWQRSRETATHRMAVIVILSESGHHATVILLIYNGIIMNNSEKKTETRTSTRTKFSCTTWLGERDQVRESWLKAEYQGSGFSDTRYILPIVYYV